MNKFISLFLLGLILASSIHCQEASESAEVEEVQGNKDTVVLYNSNEKKLSHKQLQALTRDNLGRENPDGMNHGFFAAWPFLLLCLSAACVVIAVLGAFGHITGLCRNKNNRHNALPQEA